LFYSTICQDIEKDYDKTMFQFNVDFAGEHRSALAATGAHIADYMRYLTEATLLTHFDKIHKL
jgi:hypothetical protein